MAVDDIFIETPDGTIELDRQSRYDVGHHSTNIESLVFADVTLDDAGIRERAVADQATSGNDDIIGTRYSDVVAGGTGNDTLDGWLGDDVFLFSPGDGNDVVQGFNDGFDIIRFSGGPTQFSDLVISETAGDAVVTYNGTDTITVDKLVASLLDQDDFQFV
ncbi:hypothetical protein [Roseovarius rhodophyticola]|uniref:Calcium-binding protein n=1 Tax=Roseovarius rhodophyticola TaxID=3080827 RepID=A0ABZ2TID6_9RHOB|nr:hypothetical protein [Roseovarius sp. W115]MDV2929332.1 hypothetical protein [Roseovarius sp. W115]